MTTAHNTTKTTMSFSQAPFGYTSKSGFATWMEPRFQEQARELGPWLLDSLQRLTKAQLRAFVAESGGHAYADDTKSDLVCQAYNAQWAAWWPTREV